MSALFAAIKTLWSPDARRYAIIQHGDTAHYGQWRIHFDPPPIPCRGCDWHWAHDDFDGAPDANDNRCGSAASFAACLNECDEWEDESAWETGPALLPAEQAEVDAAELAGERRRA